MNRAGTSQANQRRADSSGRRTGDVRYIVPIDHLSAADVAVAGGKGANLGELLRAGLPVPPGFVVNVAAYEAARDGYGLRPRLHGYLDNVDVDDPTRLDSACEAVIGLIRLSPLPSKLLEELRIAYDRLVDSDPHKAVIVRSSATLEDSAHASFAGMNRTCPNVLGFDAVVQAVKTCWASQFAPRAVSYRERNGFPVADATIAVLVQRYVPARESGVMFTIDPTTGDAGRLVIEATVGGGEALVSGRVTPDLFVIDKRSREIVARSVERKELRVDDVASGGTAEHPIGDDEGRLPAITDECAHELARLAAKIEDRYGTPQDIEWVIDIRDALWIVQSRPLTSGVARTGSGGAAGEEPAGEVVVTGLGASAGVATGRARILGSLAEADELGEGDVLVAHMTAPDWVPLMRRAAAVVTDSGGMTCHAAIVARELGIPCIVGTHSATRAIHEGELVTVDGTAGTVVRGSPPAAASSGRAAVEPRSEASTAVPETATSVLVNLSEPSQADRVAKLECDGVGLLRAELLALEALDGVHPRALLEDGRSGGFVDRLAEGIRTFAAAFAPRPVTYRAIDFRTDEFRVLAGGERFETVEANPVIGHRGAARYVDEPDLFDLELEALAHVRTAGYANVRLMLPFVRTPREVAACRRRIAEAGLLDGDPIELWIMAEVPSVLPYLEQYAELGVYGVSIGSNDLTQLVLGVDRGSELLAARYDERDEAVTWFVDSIVRTARGLGMETSTCGQAPAVHAEFLDLLVRAGIDSISVDVDVLERSRLLIARAEQRLILEAARDQVGFTGRQDAARART